jgi:ubiquinone/menaquinone biosynthesis C-methylase UbiE
MAANYNNSAWFYDRLSRLVYGRALINAQVYLLQFIPAGAKVLIVGGGTGWILDELSRIHPSGLKITYVEVASSMMGRSKKRNTGNNQVVFIQAAIENVSLPADFDVVVTPFLFDSFTDSTVDNVFGHIHAALKAKGIWLYVDFQLTKKWWQQFLLKLMLKFFKLICNIEASRLPDIEKWFKQLDYKIMAQQTFLYDFVIAEVYQLKQ